MVKVIDDPDPAKNPPALALTNGEEIKFGNEVLSLVGCLDAMDGSTISGFWSLTSAETLDWQMFASDVPVSGDSIQLDYMPPPEAWAQLRTHQTRQWLTIDTIEIPDAWEDAVVQAAPGQIPDGAVAYTITGTRHRTGYWGTDLVTTTHDVAFTVFLTCTPERNQAPAPADPIIETCVLLRLSQLDNPLR